MAQQTAVMQLINFILVERRQEDGSIKFHAHEDFGRFLQIEKEHIKNAFEESRLTHSMIGFKHQTFEQYYNEIYGKEGI